MITNVGSGLCRRDRERHLVAAIDRLRPFDIDGKSAALILDPLAVDDGIGFTNCAAFVTGGFQRLIRDLGPKPL